MVENKLVGKKSDGLTHDNILIEIHIRTWLIYLLRINKRKASEATVGIFNNDAHNGIA